MALEQDRLRWQASLVERDGQRERVLDLYQNGYLPRPELEERIGAIEQARGTILEQLATLNEQETTLEEESLPPDLLPELQRRLDQGLSDAERQEILRLLVRRITVHTTVQDNGKKTQRALIEYRLPGGGATCTGRGLSHLRPALACPHFANAIVCSSLPGADVEERACRGTRANRRFLGLLRIPADAGKRTSKPLLGGDPVLGGFDSHAAPPYFFCGCIPGSASIPICYRYQLQISILEQIEMKLTFAKHHWPSRGFSEPGTVRRLT